MKILNVKVIQKGAISEVKGSLIVANHLSYLDVVILVSSYPSLFITSIEIRDTFLLGRISRLAGCFFIERRKARLTSEIKDKEFASMNSKLAEGFNVFLFPEGTSSSGERVLPFKSHFFHLAEAGLPVIPLCLKYVGKNREVLPWYGAMTFPDHLFRICQLSKIEVEVNELSKVVSSNKFELAQKTQNLISECYG